MASAFSSTQISRRSYHFRKATRSPQLCRVPNCFSNDEAYLTSFKNGLNG